MPKVADLVMRVGAAFVFLYPPMAALRDPDSWLSYFPKSMRGIVPDPVLLHSFGVLEVVLALWVLSGKHIRMPALLMTVLLAGIIIFDLHDFDVLFRDVAIACMTAALAISHWNERAA